MKIEQRVTPFLSFNHQAKEAAEFYVSIIPDSRIKRTVTNPANGSVMLVEFVLGGVRFNSLNVGQDWEFTNAFSLSVGCETQEEIDRLWEALTDGGKEIDCCWLRDKFGVAWQVVPARIGEWMSDPDPAKSGRVMGALMQMVKPDLARLAAAYEGR